MFVSDNVEEYHHEDIKALKKMFANDDVKIISCDCEDNIFTVEMLLNDERRVLGL